MEKKRASQLGVVLFLVVVLLVPTQTECVLSSQQEPVQINGVKMMTYYKPTTAIDTGPSTSRPGGGGKASP
ncbi:unnamed protein product [Arabis nemorensis]|uniref:Transmembrane protein n=1 Tax=Arabis nemorensis TaxID=586526 RepID=A0A565C2S7_9BRAS|nr:unnamed protein product [Arabis nemorensis]